MMRNKKVIGVAVLSALCITALAGAAVIFAQEASEERVIADASKVKSESVYASPWNEDTLYKDYVGDQEIGRAVCEKYGLDFETVKRVELDRPMFEYQLALELLKDYSHKPLFGEHMGGLYDVLEVSLDDIYADKVSGVILKRICAEMGLDPKTAVIGDLSVDQLMEIQEECYQTSRHSKE